MTEDATLLQGKLALVTGSSSGAGVEIATALARRGARVAVHYRTSRAAAEMVARAIGDGGGEAAAFQADIARADDVRRLIEEVGERLGPHLTVNAVVPSQIAGPRTDTMPAYRAAAIAATPLGRLVTPGEIAQMVVLLCSPAFDFVTGRAIVMDGGRTIPVFARLNLAAGMEP